GGEKRRGLADVAGRRFLAQGDVLPAALLVLFGEIVPPLGADVTGNDAIDPDAVLGKLDGDRPRQALHAPLRRDVGGAVGYHAVRRVRSDVDNRPSAPGDHLPGGALRAE